jgi:Ni/Co efflux regulator RcnB
MEHSMNRKPVLTAVVVLSMTLGSLAFAQSREGNDRNDRYDRYDRYDQNDRNRNDRDQRNQQNYSNHNEYRDGRGAGPDHAFYRGQRLPSQYHRRQYVVDDWNGHNLSRPPRGYHWVQTGGDYVLVAIATGVILQMMLSR